MVSWQNEIRSAIKDRKSLEDFFNHNFPLTSQPIFIPLKLATRIKEMGINSPLGKQFLPFEKENDPIGLADPIGDFKPGPLPYFIHRYKNRALFFPTTVCPVQCRYCFRKNTLHNEELNLNSSFEEITPYLKDHGEINEIIFSGGDPFMLSGKKLLECCDFFSQFKHIKYLRFHTRVPTILPSRITKELIQLLRSLKERWKITIVIHTNHLDEIDPSVEKAFHQLREFNPLSQSVLLKEVNDHPDILQSLFEKLLDHGIRPYYLHHPDQVQGGMHFYLPIEEGKEIDRILRQRMSGWMLPQYIIDSPTAEGKTSVLNKFNYLEQKSPIQNQGIQSGIN